MLNDFFLITRIGVVFSGLLAKEGKCQVTRMARRTLFFSMVFALSACGGDDNSVVATPDNVVADVVADVVAEVVVVDLSVTALNKIQSYAAQGTAVPTVDDYKAAGITGVDVYTLGVTNTLIKASDADEVDTLAKIQIIANVGANIGFFKPKKSQPTLSVYAGDSEIKLNWDAVPNSASYTLCYATQSLGIPADIDNCAVYTNGTLVQNLGTSVEGTSATDIRHRITGLVNGTTYYFALAAIDSGGNKIWSSSVVIATPIIVRRELNDTGITFGGNHPSGNNTDCTGVVIAQQDCSHGRDASHNDDSDGHEGFSFTKLNSYGTALEASASVWSCVQDNVTGLTWEVKTAGGVGLRLHNANDTYRLVRDWIRYNTDDHFNTCEGYVIGQPVTYCNAAAFTARVNGPGFCGAHDWRLPTIEELAGIVDYGATDPAIDTDYFPNALSAHYWSLSPYFRSYEVWTVNFNHGGDGLRRRSDNNSHVRLVRRGQ